MTVAHAILALVALTVPAVSTAAAQEQSIAVEVGDLDLETDKGQRILALRIQRAARSICKGQAPDRLPQNIRNERRCIRQARSAAAVAVMALKAVERTGADRGG